MNYYNDISRDIDELGRIKAQIKALEVREEELTTRIKGLQAASQANVFHGDAYTAQFSTGRTGDTMNVKAAIARYGREWLINQGYLNPGKPTLIMKIVKRVVEEVNLKAA